MATGKEPARRDVLSISPSRESAALEPAGGHILRTLSPGECFELLEPGGIGRVGFTSSDGIMMLPVNFVLSGKAVVFRTAPDTLLAVYATAQVSFESDRLDEIAHEGWSVLIQGHAHKISDEREIRHLEERACLQPWASGARDVYVRIAPIRISGRRLGPG